MNVIKKHAELYENYQIMQRCVKNHLPLVPVGKTFRNRFSNYMRRSGSFQCIDLRYKVLNWAMTKAANDD